MTTLLLYLAVTPASVIAFDGIEAAHSRLSSASLTATFKSTGLAQDITQKYELRYRWPYELKLRSLSPTTGKLIRERVIEPTRVIDYDPFLEQYTVTARAGREPIGSTIALLDQNLDDMLLAYTTKEGFDVWLSDMRKLDGWRLTGSSNKLTLSYSAKDKKIVLEVRKPSLLVQRLDVQTGGQRIVSEITYARSVASLAFRPPKGVYEVSTFDQEMRPVKYASPDAQKVALKMFDAYASLSSLGFEVQRETGKTKVQIRGKFLRQDDDTASWSYDGKSLNFFDKRSGSWYSGKLSFSDVIDAVGDRGTRVDPTARLLYTRFNPYRKRLGDGSLVKLAGSMPLNGSEVSILECESEHTRVTLFVREDGLVVGSSVRGKVTTGDPDESVELRYNYFSVAKDVAAKQRVAPPKGTKPTVLKPSKTTI